MDATIAKPNHKKIREDGFCEVDMHVHSRYSDSFAKVRDLLKRAKNLGIGISITDHNEVTGSIKAAQQENLVIPGIEITAKEGTHLLAYFYSPHDLQHFFDTTLKGKRSKNPTIGRRRAITQISTTNIVTAR